MAVPSKLSAETFLGLVKQSGLIEAELLKKTWKEMKEQGIGTNDPHPIADELVRRNVLTRWQADKLLKGRHKGFFLGKYRLLSHLGSGGMSQVYLAEHVLMRRRVAIKVLPDSRVNDSSYLERFHREAQAVAALDHRNIVRAYDVDQEGKIHFLVMEYVPGRSLHEVVARQGRLDYVAACEYMRQAAEGLQHAHRIGMVHRDIKPGNLLLDEKGTVKLLDLGLARFFDEEEEKSLTVKHDEKVLGTADYLSPEQALDSHKVDIRSDIYSLGCTLYYLLTGHPPFPAGTLAQRLLAHQTKSPQPIVDDRSDIPASLTAILDKMMAKKPDARYQTARDAAQALTDWLSENGGDEWTRMNPAVGSSSQVFAGLPESPSGSSVLAGDSGTSGAPSTPGAVASSGIGNPFASPAPSTAAAFAQMQETSRDPDVAAFFSHLAGEGSTKISRPVRDKPPIVEPPPTITIPPEPDFSSITAISTDGPEPDFPVTSLELPPAGPASFESASALPEGEFAPTILVPQVEHAPAAPRESTPVAAPVSTESRPPVARPASPGRTARPPVAKPVSSAPAALAKVTAGKVRIPPAVWVGGSSILVVLVAAVGFFLFSRGGASTAEVAENQNEDSEKVGKKAGTKGGKSGVPSALPERGEYTVGRTGKFASIGAALAEIKRHPNNKSRKAVQIVKVAGGQTYSERIVIDESYPRGIQIVAEAGPPPVLAPSGPDPIVVVHPSKDTVENFRLEGFQLDAAGKDVAVEISEWVLGMRLKRLEVTGFSRTGLFFDGAQTYGDERDRIVAEGITFRNAAPGATGILFSRKTEDPRYVRVSQCRFLGPLHCGIRFESSAIGIEISECIFYRTVTGVALVGDDRVWNDMTFSANTFFENERGLVFTSMPAPATRDLGFYNNLFAGTKISDAVVEKDFRDVIFLSMYRVNPGGSGYNWTTRPASVPARPDEIHYLFETVGGEVGRTDVSFLSTDPSSADFLVPARDSPHRQRGTLLDPKKFGPQIGAVRAK